MGEASSRRRKSAPARRGELVVFLGPSLPRDEALRLAPSATLLPPAAQGDVWRALELRPRAIALVDGVFEHRPSVWHHELLDALDAGVAVFGAASMGALRAAELHAHGMVGVGEIYRAYRDGALAGDDEVALLHLDGSYGFRALTVPLVAVRAAAAAAQAARALSPRDARALVGAAARVFYQDRTWPAVLAAARLSSGARARWDAFAARGLPDPKADDARACLAAAARFLAARAPADDTASTSVSGAPASAPWPPRPRPSHVRRRRLEGSPVFAALARDRRAADGVEDGLRTLALAALGRSLGVEVSRAEAEEAGAAWLDALGVPRRSRAAFLAASGLDPAEALRLFEALALERRVLDRATHLLPDGPSAPEGLALSARLRGAWARTSRTSRKVKHGKEEA